MKRTVEHISHYTDDWSEGRVLVGKHVVNEPRGEFYISGVDRCATVRGTEADFKRLRAMLDRMLEDWECY